MKRALYGIFFVAFAVICGCGGGGGGSGSPSIPHGPGTPTPAPTSTPTPSGKKIQHIVIVIQENRSFDNLFATFPGADGTTYGILTHRTEIQPRLRGRSLGKELNHLRCGYRTEYDDGKMDGFDLISFGSGCTGRPAGTFPLRYVESGRYQAVLGDGRRLRDSPITCFRRKAAAVLRHIRN